MIIVNSDSDERFCNDHVHDNVLGDSIGAQTLGAYYVYTCNICGKSFYTYESYQSHVQSAHKTNFLMSGWIILWIGLLVVCGIIGISYRSYKNGRKLDEMHRKLKEYESKQQMKEQQGHDSESSNSKTTTETNTEEQK